MSDERKGINDREELNSRIDAALLDIAEQEEAEERIRLEAAKILEEKVNGVARNG